MKDPSTILRREAYSQNGTYQFTPIPLLLESCHHAVIVDVIPAACWILQRLSFLHIRSEFVNEYCRLCPDVRQDIDRFSRLVELIDEGIYWLQKAGLIDSEFTGYAFGTHRLSQTGRDAHFLLLRYLKLCKALDFLIDTKKRDLRFGSAEEERLNITLAGHSEWLKHDWFVRNASWVKEAASLLVGWNNLSVTSAWINAVQCWKKWSSSYDA